MKMITSTLTGLASSLFLNAGLAQLAEKLDPISSLPASASVEAHGPAACFPCNFTPKHRK
jgi:hypothetical protein